jgi:hypothetical protein
VGLLQASGRPVPDNDDETRAARDRIRALEPGLQDPLLERVRSLAEGYTAVSLGAWSHALQIEATRVGFLLCGDLLRVGRAVADEEGPEALEALLAFALSTENLDLRERLDLATAL